MTTSASMTTAPQRRFSAIPGTRRWLVSLSAITAVTALSIDMSLPAQPALAHHFGIGSDKAQLTLSLFLLGYAGAQLIVGFLSDAFGRRRVMLAGLGLFTLSGLLCALSPSIELLLLCRFLQGLGAAAGPVVARAMVRDTQPPATAARLLSTMLAVLAIAPMVAPSIGGLLLKLASWRAIFATLCVFGVAFMLLVATSLDETLPEERRGRASLQALSSGIKRFVTTPGTLTPAVLGCITSAGQFAYISASPFVLIEGYRVAPEHYGLFFVGTAAALMIGSTLGGKMLAAGRSPQQLISIGSVVLCISGLSVAAAAHLPALGVIGFMLPMTMYFLGVGMAGPSATALALAPVPEIAGTASSLIGFTNMSCGAVAGWLATKLGGSTPHVLGVIVALMGCSAAALIFTQRRARALSTSG